MDPIKLPRSIEELIIWLDKLYPARTPKITESERQIWMYAGKRELIETLIQRYKVNLTKGGERHAK